jgi:hypothetical protein
MWRGFAGVLLLLTVGVCQAPAQTVDPPRPKTVLPGLRLGPVPEIAYAHLPQVPRGEGLVVEQIGSEAPANLGELKRFDILLSYDGKALKDVDQFNRLVLAAKLNQKAPLKLVRAGKEMTLDIALNTGELTVNTLKGAIKPGGPPAVAIECTFLGGDKLQIMLAYYSEKNSKLETVTCSGSLSEVEQQVRDYQLPNAVQELVEVAFKRLRTGNKK